MTTIRPALALALLTVSLAAFGQSSLDCGTLTPGPPIERVLDVGARHSYIVDLAAGDYVQIDVAQKRCDVVVTLFDDRGQQLAQADTPRERGGEESISIIAGRGGPHRIEIALGARETSAGRYAVAIEQLRTASAEDVHRVAADRLFAEGERLRGEGGEENLRAAAARYGEALPLWEAGGDLEMLATTYHQRGYVQDLVSDYPNALKDYEKALALQEEAGSKRRQAETLSNMGVVYRVTGNPARARELYERALELRRAEGDVTGQGSTLHNLGTLFWTQGDFGKAADYYAQALLFRREAGDRVGEAETLMGLGMAARASGNPHKALETYAEALAIKQAIGDRRGEAAILHNRGVVYSTLGDFDQALEHYARSLQISREEGDRSWEGAALVSSGIATKFLGQYERSLKFFEQALAVRRATGRKREEAEVLSNMGLLQETLGKAGAAAELYAQALPLNREVNDRRGEAFTLGNLGSALAAAGDPAKGLQRLEEALAIQRSIRDENGEAETRLSIAQIARDGGDLVKARASVEEALRIIEALRGRIASPSLRSTYRALKQSQHAVYIDILMRLHDREPAAGHDLEALIASEQSRARTLRELLAESRIDLHQGIDQGLLDQRRSVLEKITARERERARLAAGKSTPEQLAALDATIAALLSEYEQNENRMRAASPRYAALMHQPPLDRAALLSLLDRDTVLVEYALGFAHSYAWVLSHEGLLSVRLPAAKEIDASVRRLLDLIQAGPKRETEVPLQRAAAQLSAMVLGPLKERLSNKRLLVVPDGSLQYVPFAALPDPTTPRSPLIAQHEIVTLPSAVLLATLRSGEPAADRKLVAVIADPVLKSDDPRVGRSEGSELVAAALPPDLLRAGRESGVTDFERLPYTRREADSIVKLAGTERSLAATGFRASRDTVLSSALHDFRIVHFATHGLINNEHPDLSGIVLSMVDERGEPQDGFLRLRDIYRLELDADLVVLSACRTALGRDIRGEGMMGLTRGFMYAGARRVMASLWDVRDQATAELMDRFYRGLIKEKLPPAAALRAAQLSLAREPRWRSPFYWAPFVVQGDWR